MSESVPGDVPIDGEAIVLGATSAMARAVALRLVALDVPLLLVGRNELRVQQVADDLSARGARVRTLIADPSRLEFHEAILAQGTAAGSWWFFWGQLPDQSACEADPDAAQEALRINFLSVVALLGAITVPGYGRPDASLVVVGSVAGDRGRASNYVYGAAKGGVERFVQGLRNRLSATERTVLLVKPGFVDTPMTAHVEKSPALLWASAEHVADDIVKAWQRGAHTLYTPWFWRAILAVVCAVPERIFKRLSL